MNLHSGQILSFIAKQLKSGVSSDGDLSYITLDRATAFEFSSFTGATYVDNATFPFSPRPHLKLFDKPFSLEFVTGMFENGQAISSVQKITENYPIVSATKYKLVLCPFETESEWRTQLRSLLHAQSQDEPFLALRLEVSKKGWGLEPLLEWAFAMELKSNGLITESQVPFGLGVGTPDTQGFISHFSRQLIEVVTGKKLATLSIPELLGYHFFGPASTSHGIWKGDSIVVIGEAKTGGSSAAKQLKKYSDSGLLDIAYFLSDSATSNLIFETYLTDAYRINPKVQIPSTGLGTTSAYINWLELSLIAAYAASLDLEAQAKILQKFGLTDLGKLPSALSQLGKSDILRLLQ